MIIQALAFYLFASVTLASAVMVISARNPVHSVLFLILAFFNAAALFVLMGAEFLAMILVVVYVGAVAVLFLFVVMMLDINFVALREGFLQYLPVGGLIGLILLVELIMVVAAWSVAPDAPAVEVQVGDDRLRVSAGVFLEGNAWLRVALAERVHAAAGSGARRLQHRGAHPVA